jgi:hypothetical protein
VPLRIKNATLLSSLRPTPLSKLAEENLGIDEVVKGTGKRFSDRKRQNSLKGLPEVFSTRSTTAQTPSSAVLLSDKSAPFKSTKLTYRKEEEEGLMMAGSVKTKNEKEVRPYMTK